MSYEREAEPMNVDEIEVVDADDVDEMTIEGVKPIVSEDEDDEGAGPSRIDDDDDDDEGAGPARGDDDDDEMDVKGVKREASEDAEGSAKKKATIVKEKPFCNGQCAMCVAPRGSFTGDEGEVDVEEGEIDPSAWSFYSYRVCLKAGLYAERKVPEVIEKRVPSLRALSGATIERECKYVLPFILLFIFHYYNIYFLHL